MSPIYLCPTHLGCTPCLPKSLLRSGRTDLEEHLWVRALPTSRRVRDAGEVPNNGLLGNLELERVNEGVEHDL